MAFNRSWQPTPRAETYKPKKFYQYEDDKRMKIKRKPPKKLPDFDDIKESVEEDEESLRPNPF